MKFARQSVCADVARLQCGAAQPCGGIGAARQIWGYTLGALAIAFFAVPAFGAAPERPGGQQSSACAGAAGMPWPSSAATRRAMLQQLEARAAACSTDAAFLGVLGGLWLDEGDPAQAIIWLERSLLIEPKALGVHADYALALAAVGETAAKEQLLLEWRDRDDVPLALLMRLRGQVPVANGSEARRAKTKRWLNRVEASLTQGSETNLDHSPTLDGLTLTSPDGPVELPLAVPLRPRSGQAKMYELGVRTALDTGVGELWQVSFSAAGRRSSSQPGTDWHSAQLTGEMWRAVGEWRTQVQISTAAAGGPLTEPYRVLRLGAATERDDGDCTSRIALDLERRRQEVSAYLDGNTTAAVFSLRCALQSRSTWQLGLVARAAWDRPPNIGRPGGAQQQQSAALRLTGAMGRLAVDSQLRVVYSKDADGYSPLLGDNARRQYRQQQVDIDLSHPLPLWGWEGLRGVLQVTYTRQSSNIVVFVHHGTSAYAGLRWRW